MIFSLDHDISQSQKEKQIMSSYFTGNKTLYKQTEWEENPFLPKNVDSSDCQEDFQVDGQEKMITNNIMKLDDELSYLSVPTHSQ